MFTLQLVGGTALLNPLLNENKSKGNHIINMIAVSSVPPKPYLMKALRLVPLGVGYFLIILDKFNFNSNYLKILYYVFIVSKTF
jgi:hypothetical protein